MTCAHVGAARNIKNAAVQASKDKMSQREPSPGSKRIGDWMLLADYLPMLENAKKKLEEMRASL
jgi:hypothetical protein